jgi:minor extracellular serine protease Vpr
MRARLAGGVIIAFALALHGSPSGAAPASPREGIERFERLALPPSFDLSSLRLGGRPDEVVSAVVQLTGASALELSGLTGASSEAALVVVEAGQEAVIPALEAAGADVERQITTVDNAVTVDVRAGDLAALAAVPGVADIHVSRPVRRNNANSNAFTGVPSVWTDLGVRGTGMSIGVIDTGIDYHHAAFGGSGDPAAFAGDNGVSSDASFPNAKVVGGYDFVGDLYDGFTDPVPDPDPLDCDGHGTHVSGTAAGSGVTADGATFTGPYDAATMAATTFEVSPGAAPEATLYAYRVFGCVGFTNDDVLLAAIDMAVADGVDVLNMSLGYDFGAADDPVAQAIDAASVAGVLVVVAAGNSGPGAYLVGGPGTANSALSVAAADAVPGLPGVGVTGAVTATAQNSNDFVFAGPISGELVDVGLGCSLEAFLPAAGKIAVATRGDCDRMDRPLFATEAAALGVLFVNDSPGLPPYEGPIPGAAVPFVGVTPDVGAALIAAAGQSVTLEAGPQIPNPTFGSTADFSSGGPRLGDSAARPDITAPGVSVLSAKVGGGTAGQLSSGTSMATPHAAGVAALVRQLHPGWTPAQVKAALMSTADPGDLTVFDARINGAGVLDARAASDALTYFSTTNGLHNLSFGYLEMSRSTEITRRIQITNASASSVTYDLAPMVDTLGLDVRVSVSPQQLTLRPGQTRSASMTIRFRGISGIPGADANDFGRIVALRGVLVATPKAAAPGVRRLVAPVVLVPGATSEVTARYDAGGSQRRPSLALRNDGQHSGNADVYQWAIRDDVRDVADARIPDLRSVGVQSLLFDEETGDRMVVFALNTSTPASTQSINQYEISIDTDGDEIPDRIVLVIDLGGFLASVVFDANFDVVGVWSASAPANGTTVLAPALASELGATGPFSFRVSTFSWLAPGSDEAGVGIFDPFVPAVNTGEFRTIEPRRFTRILTRIDAAQVAVQKPLGWLVVTQDDRAGVSEADRVPLPR